MKRSVVNNVVTMNFEFKLMYLQNLEDYGVRVCSVCVAISMYRSLSLARSSC
jgi:hypothetical protein